MRRLVSVLLAVLAIAACGGDDAGPDPTTTGATDASTSSAPPTTSADDTTPTLYACLATETVVDGIDESFGPDGVVAGAPEQAVRGEIQVKLMAVEQLEANLDPSLIRPISELRTNLEVADEQIRAGITFAKAVQPVIDQADIARIEIVKTACAEVAEPVPIMVEHTDPNPTWAIDIEFEEPIRFEPDKPYHLVEVYFDTDGSWIEGANPGEEEAYVSFRNTADGLSISVVAQAGVSRTIVAASGDNEIGDVDEWIQWSLEGEVLHVEALQPIVEDDPVQIIIKTRATWTGDLPVVGQWTSAWDW